VVAFVNVRFGAHYGLKSDIVPSPKSACHNQTQPPQQIASLLKYLVGAGEQRRRHGEAQGYMQLPVCGTFRFTTRSPYRPQPITATTSRWSHTTSTASSVAFRRVVPVQRRQRDPLGLFDCIEKQILIHPREFCMLWRAGGVA
jgi:hypothetical protein